MRLDTTFVKHADTTYCGAALGQSQDIANWSKNQRVHCRVARTATEGACEWRHMLEPSRRDGSITRGLAAIAWQKMMWSALRRGLRTEERQAGEEPKGYLPSTGGGFWGRACFPRGNAREERSIVAALPLS